MSSRQLTYYNQSVSARPSTQSYHTPPTFLRITCAIFAHDYDVIAPSHLNANSPITRKGVTFNTTSTLLLLLLLLHLHLRHL